MNAITFIKQHGIEKAREVVKGAPENSICYDLEQQNHIAYEDTSIAMCFLKNRFIDLSDLKRLVGSVDLIKKHGGLFSTKCQLDKGGSDYEWYGENGEFGLTDLADLEQAIADYEQLFGNTEKLGGEHV